MIRVCSWCGKKMGEKPPLDNLSITHGICPKCEDRERGHWISEMSSDGNVVRGLMIALILSPILWGVAVVCLIWPLVTVALGVTFAVFCFWGAWRG